MKSALIYKHGQLTQVGCCRLLNPRYAAITAAIYTLNISIFVVLLYSWRIGVNIKRFTTLEDVYYGVQIAYLAIIGTHLFMILLSIVLLIGIYRKPAYKTAIPILIYAFYLVVIAGYAQKLANVSEENYTNACAMPWENWNVDNRKSYLIFLMGIRQPNTLSVFNLHLSNEIVLKENISLIIPWVIGFITFMALEAVSMVYSNVLRDHVNKEFDALCKAEVAFFISRVFINMLAIGGVMRFCNLLRAGISWKGPEVIEL